jgi:FHA domain/Zincin-like metallopeptidase
VWSLAQRKKGRRGSNHPLVEPDPTGLPAGSALIILEQGPNAGSRFLLDQPASVGRHPRSDIFLDDVTVSRRHVELRWEKDDFHDHVARPQRRQLCKRRDRRQQSPQEEAVAIPAPILAPLRRWMRVRGRVSMIRSKRRLTTRAELPAGRSPGGDDQRRDRRRGRASPDGQPLLGLYRGVPLPRRSSTDSGVLPDKISIFGGWSAFVFGASRPWRMTARRRQRTGNLSRLLLPTVLVRRFHSVGTSTQWETLSLGAARSPASAQACCWSSAPR